MMIGAKIIELTPVKIFFKFKASRLIIFTLSSLSYFLPKGDNGKKIREIKKQNIIAEYTIAKKSL